MFFYFKMWVNGFDFIIKNKNEILKNIQYKNEGKVNLFFLIIIILFKIYKNNKNKNKKFIF